MVLGSQSVLGQGRQGAEPPGGQPPSPPVPLPSPLPQCKPSRGRKRGICWCVDKYGMKLPGMEYVDGDFQCHTFDSSNVE